jgi:class 3 adenylate cyclase/pimeloyl-ACP methyl ester carboxylesterase
MAPIPETRRAWNGDISLAYQVLGDGPVDLLYLQGYCSNVDVSWESPYLARFLRGLSRHARLIFADRRGWGCSERFSPTDIPDVDELTDDIAAILDAVGSPRAVILASFECTVVATLFAASYPERTMGLIVVDPVVTYLRTEETPWMPSLEDVQKDIAEIHAQWGTPAWTEHWTDTREAEWFQKYLRASAAPGAAIAEFRRYFDVDVRAVLPTIQVPTLVFGDAAGRGEVPIQTAELVVDRIPGARLVEQSSAGGSYRLHWYARGEAIVAEIGRFLTQLRADEASFDRVLATVLFTDIAGSTAAAAEAGDLRWKEILERHHATVRTLLARYRGREIDTAGDGFFASFDGPARAVHCARAIVEAMRHLGLEVRAGLHTGEVETIGGKIGGIAVNIGARVAAVASPGEVLVSSTVRDLVAGAGLIFEDAGDHELKGVPERWRLFRVVDG